MQNKHYSLMNKIHQDSHIFQKIMFKINFNYLDIERLKKNMLLIKNNYSSLIIDIESQKKSFIVNLLNIKGLTPCNNDDVKKSLKKIIIEMKKIHLIPINKENNTYFLLNLYNSFLKIIKNPFDNYKKYQSYIIKKTKFNKKNNRLCHNDLHCNNIVVIKNKIKLIDWDFVDINDYHYDLASLASECELNYLEIKKICKYYSKNASVDRVLELINIELIIFSMWANYMFENTKNIAYLKIFTLKNQKLKNKKLNYY